MLRMIDQFLPLMKEKGWDVTAPNVVQTLSEEQLIEMLPDFDGWIAGDDPANRRVLSAGVSGRLRALVKWGVGVDNVDFKACQDLNLKVSNTPKMFGHEVADVAIGLLLMVTRRLHIVDQGVRRGQWLKPSGESLVDKEGLVVGFGDIGQQTAHRLAALGMRVRVVDPIADPKAATYPVTTWEEGRRMADVIVMTCPLNDQTRHMVDRTAFQEMKRGCYFVNVSRGPVVDETALIEALQSKQLAGAGLDVFEVEPLPENSELISMENVALGSHNGSNSRDGVIRATHRAIELMEGLLK